MNDFPKGKFGVIYADPPWLFKMHSEKGHAKGPQYPCMTFDELAALRDQILWAAAPDAVLVMWSSWAADPSTGVDFMQQAMDLGRIWGFARVSGGSWGKTTKNGKQAIGPGYNFRSADEPFLLFKVGSPRVKNHSTRNRFYTGDIPENLNEIGISITAMAREHSRKPDEFAVMLQELFEGPYLELFARTAREGWSVWGNETDKFSS